MIHAAQIPSPSEIRRMQGKGTVSAAESPAANTNYIETNGTSDAELPVYEVIPDTAPTYPNTNIQNTSGTLPGNAYGNSSAPGTLPGNAYGNSSMPGTLPGNAYGNSSSPGTLPSNAYGNSSAPVTLPSNVMSPTTPDLQPIDAPSAGALKIEVTSALGLMPIPDAVVSIYETGEPDVLLETLTTNSSGQTDVVELPAPPLEWSLEPSEQQPYSLYNISVTAPGYEPILISGAEIFADQLSYQPVRMNPLSATEEEEKVVVIPPHTLFYEYPAKIPEEEIKPIAETGEIVLSKVVIPEYVIVHDGVPSDATAPNYWVRYKDYIKNVASCEIYSTWPEATIYANILVIMSFTLNRVYTEWYRNQGYDFTITSSTAYDQKWIYGHNIFENIDLLVDTVFANYLSRPGVKQPIFTSYCDGKNVNCSGLSQWGSKYLGDEGYSAIEIIRNYYGNDMYINTAESISGVPSSWPGYNLSIGSAGDKVRQLQSQLNRIARNYPAIPTLTTDGIYGPMTAEAVSTFQGIFGLPQTGVTDYATWYEVSDIYVGVSRISEPGT
jgi:hypothetical protein